MSRWKGKSRGNVLGYKIFVFLLKNFGLSPAYFALKFTAFYFFLTTPGAFRAIYFYLNNILGYNPLKSVVGVYRNFYVFGQTIIDKFVVFSNLGGRFTFQFDGEENLTKMAEGGQGGILISAHLGNWDIAGHLLGRLQAPINIVMFDAENQNIKEYFERLQVRKTLKIITVKDNMSHVFEISKAIANKELVCMHGDRFVAGSKVITCDFFGKPARFPQGPFQIAAKLKVPCTFVFAMKETNTHYHLYATAGKVHQGSIESLVKEYAEQLEKIVLEYPYQWFNHYQFWD